MHFILVEKDVESLLTIINQPWVCSLPLARPSLLIGTPHCENNLYIKNNIL